MLGIVGVWPSKHGEIIKSELSKGRRKNYFHRWWSLPTIGSDLNVIWEISAKNTGRK